MHVSAKFSVFEVLFNESSFYEHKWITINLRGNDSLLVCYIYHSTTSNFQQSTVILCDLF